MQFSLKFMGVAVFFAAFICVALLNANRLWGQIVFTFAVLLLLCSIISAVYSRGGTRAYWLGASVFGWGYFVLAMGLPLIGFENEMVTHGILNSLRGTIQKQVKASEADVREGTEGFRRTSPTGMAVTFVLIPTRLDFSILVHSLWTILFAGVGGLVAKYLHFKMDTRATALLETVLEFASSDYSHKRQQAEMALEKLGDLGATTALQAIVKKFSGSDDSHKTQIASRALELM